MITFPTLHTGRLVLRKPRLQDIPALLQYVNNSSITENMISLPYPFLEEDAVVWLANTISGFRSGERHIFAITMQEKDELIGAIGLHLQLVNNAAEIGYWLAQPYWNKGIITEANKAIIAYGFKELGLNRIFASHFDTNPASGRVLQKSGMIYEAEIRNMYRIRGEYRDVVQYRITRAEYDLGE
jgi:RimJ/RimL family protein N-acetyltransferase